MDKTSLLIIVNHLINLSLACVCCNTIVSETGSETPYPLSLWHGWRKANVRFVEIIDTTIFFHTFLHRSVEKAGRGLRGGNCQRHQWPSIEEHDQAYKLWTLQLTINMMILVTTPTPYARSYVNSDEPESTDKTSWGIQTYFLSPFLWLVSQLKQFRRLVRYVYSIQRHQGSLHVLN